MFQRLTRKGQATYARIVETAAELMYQRGVAGTSNEDVRDSAGVSNSQLYHYFVDRRALVCAVINYQTERVLADQEPLLSRLDSFEALAAWRDMLVDSQQRHNYTGGCPLGSLANELADADEEARTIAAEGFARWSFAISKGLRAMHQRGDLRPEADPDALALGTLAALQGGLLLDQTAQDSAPLAAGMDMAIGYIQHFAT